MDRENHFANNVIQLDLRWHNKQLMDNIGAEAFWMNKITKSIIFLYT